MHLCVLGKLFRLSCGLRNTVCEKETNMNTSFAPQPMTYAEAYSYCKSMGSNIITMNSLIIHWDRITKDLIEDIHYRNPKAEFQLDFWTSAQAC